MLGRKRLVKTVQVIVLHFQVFLFDEGGLLAGVRLASAWRFTSAVLLSLVLNFEFLFVKREYRGSQVPQWSCWEIIS